MSDILLPKQKLQRVQILVSLTRQDVQLRKQCATLFGWKKTVSMMFIQARIGYASIDTLNKTFFKKLTNKKTTMKDFKDIRHRKCYYLYFFIADGTVTILATSS